MNEGPTAPVRYCDLVMKGGVTSGVVYPSAAAKLSEKFVFRNIGGTSAGAIAAAATAVAERARATGGFAKLGQLPNFLTEASPGGTGSNLFAFFQPQPETLKLFSVCVSALGGKGAGLRILLQLGRSYPVQILIGALPGLLFIWGSSQGASGAFLWACWLVGLLLFILGVVLSLVWAMGRDAVSGLTGNFYGMCSGMTAEFHDVGSAPPPGKGKPLTYWLTEYLNSYVAKGPSDAPITFGELWGTRDPSGVRAVNLEMMTTCLTHGRPYQLPFREDEDVRENSQFLFRRDEFDRLFPKSVVDWMASHPRTISPRDAARMLVLKEQGYLPLPEPADLPIVVAVRMSLSFPVLLSAVPLHGIDWVRDPKGLNPERCWFTDGGVCSNFPIHFFDSPIPGWPTLGINLVDKPSGTKPSDLLKPEMPMNNSSDILESWNLFEVNETVNSSSGKVQVRSKSGLSCLLSFGGAFIDTMQNWTDNIQSRLPGYRDRIAAIGLTPEEGGLNLNMPAQRIEDLSARGASAANEFIERFGFPAVNPIMNWSNHRWIRMRTCLASLEEFALALVGTYDHPQDGDQGYGAWIAATPPDKAPSYEWTSDQRDMARQAIEALRGAVKVTTPSKATLVAGSPRPRPELRPRPRL